MCLLCADLIKLVFEDRGTYNDMAAFQPLTSVMLLKSIFSQSFNSKQSQWLKAFIFLNGLPLALFLSLW